MDKQVVPEAAESQHWVIGYFFTLNATIGAGVLSIPWAFAQMGWTLGLLSQVFVSLAAYILVQLLIEVLSRIEALERLYELGYTIRPLALTDLLAPKPAPEYLLLPAEDSESSPLVQPVVAEQGITGRRFDFAELARTFYGRSASRLMVLLLVCFEFPLLAGYATVFGSSMASTVPIYGETCNVYHSKIGEDCWLEYASYVCVFLVLMTVLVLVGLAEQVAVQVFTTVARFLVIGVILGTSLAALAREEYFDREGTRSATEVPAAEFSNFVVGFPILLGAASFHNTFPNTVQFVRDKAHSLRTLATLAVVTCGVVYLLMGLIVPAALEDMEKMVTLAWVDYSAGKDSQSWWTYCIEYTVVLLPIIDVFSVFPIVAINMSDNLLALLVRNYTVEGAPLPLVVVLRLCSSILPVFVALVLHDLSIVMRLTGTLLILVVGVGVPLFHIAAKTMVPAKGPFDAWFSAIQLSYCTLIVHLGLFGLILGTELHYVLADS